ncbi:probable inactive heme oxygenase 2, chloroplastic [Lolium rigidum]|uniref:probable inactive heme oxygenase 2, chloroplastic n=1 Tax=Lolium rigidum TaxID=89674 RepID=UPI001F5C9A40|nr:probable inactive heme oxygenase 2, chloroplastic [Lolium rigidum]
MPLVVVVPSAAPPLRRPQPSRFLHPRRNLALTRARCAPSPPAEAQSVKPPRPRRYPKQFPGEAVGVAEEMRFVAMRLRNPKKTTLKDNTGAAEDDESDDEDQEVKEDNSELEEEEEEEEEEEDEEEEDNHQVAEEGDAEVEGEWMPSIEGFVRYLVDSKLVFDTVERVVAGSTDVAYVYFRKGGLERSASIEKDLEWFREQGFEIPEPSTHGSTYASYLSELAGSNAPAFLSHYYNIYFSHTTGGLAIGKKICDKILEGRVLEFYKWDTDAELLLKDAREKLNELSKHWSRKDRNLCLKETAKCFQYMGRIVRLIIS